MSNLTASAYKERLKRFSDFLEDDTIIDVKGLREYCFEGGCPDDNTHYRSLTWKLLLGYISSNKNDWKESLDKKRSIYKEFVYEFVTSNHSITQNNDHPLSSDPTSQWNKYFRDNEVLSQIFKDVRRLYPDISFFQQKMPKKSFLISNADCDIIGRAGSCKAGSIDIYQSTHGFTQTKQTISRDVNYIFDDDFGDLANCHNEEYHWQVVARILFIYARLNGQKYVQGMNEIIGPIFYVFANDSKEEWRAYCEADTFWCFTSLMSEIRDMYDSQFDADQSTGIVSMMTELTNLLLQKDRQLYYHIYQNQMIRPHYYAFRWITLLLSQEFPLPEVLRLWDFLFSDDNRFSFLLQICCAMLMLLHDDLMHGDFACNMKLLQNFPDKIDVSTVVTKAKSIRCG